MVLGYPKCLDLPMVSWLVAKGSNPLFLLSCLSASHGLCLPFHLNGSQQPAPDSTQPKSVTPCDSPSFLYYTKETLVCSAVWEELQGNLSQLDRGRWYFAINNPSGQQTFSTRLTEIASCVLRFWKTPHCETKAEEFMKCTLWLKCSSSVEQPCSDSKSISPTLQATTQKLFAFVWCILQWLLLPDPVRSPFVTSKRLENPWFLQGTSHLTLNIAELATEHFEHGQTELWTEATCHAFSRNPWGSAKDLCSQMTKKTSFYVYIIYIHTDIRTHPAAWSKHLQLNMAHP